VTRRTETTPPAGKQHQELLAAPGAADPGELEGGNHGFLDGHAEWLNARTFIDRPKLILGSTEIFFGDPQANRRPAAP
jgi:hypothetical protein